jgi:hypothetical protein
MSIKSYRREFMRCRKCGRDVVWDINDEEDKKNFNGVIDKMKDHTKNDNACKREVFLSEILGEKIEKGIGIVGVEQSPDFIVRQITIENKK